MRALALSDDGAVLFSGSWDGSIRAWRASDGLYLYTLEGHSGAVLALAQSLNGEVRSMDELLCSAPPSHISRAARTDGLQLNRHVEVLRPFPPPCRFCTQEAKTAQ